MIVYSEVQPFFNPVFFDLIGDGTSTGMSVDLSLPPFNFPFAKFSPAGFGITTDQPGITATATLTTHVLALTFSSAPDADFMGVTATPFFNSLVGGITYSLDSIDYNFLSLTATGNGTDTVLEINLSASAVGLPFNGSIPSVEVGGVGPAATASITNGVDGDIMTVTFSDPLPADTPLGINFSFTYSSLT
jgi:hypothetical protein